MHKWHYRGLVLWACLALVGCAERSDTVKPAQALAQLRAGRALLTCREPCLAEWRGAQPQAAQLDAGARWQDLAMLLTRVGYQDDLSLYYLGRSAEGLGYREAAASYYRQSTQLSGTAGSCQSLSQLCGGMVLPWAARSRLAAIERELNRARPRRTEQAPQGPPMPEAAPAETEALPPTPAPTAAPRPPGPPPSEFIEPPPAAR
jgi:hypothetical protein